MNHTLHETFSFKTFLSSFTTRFLARPLDVDGFLMMMVVVTRGIDGWLLDGIDGRLDDCDGDWNVAMIVMIVMMMVMVFVGADNAIRVDHTRKPRQ